MIFFFQNPQVPASSVIDAGSLHILEQLKFGKINVRQAADLLKVDPTILAYELAAKVSIFSSFSEFKKNNQKIISFFFVQRQCEWIHYMVIRIMEM